MKKLKTFLQKNTWCKRALSALLAVTLVVGLFNGLRFVANAAEPYYGDQPEADGYYAQPIYTGYTAMSGDLVQNRDLYNLYNRPSMIRVEGSVESRADYSRGYGAGDVIIRGRTEMAEKWKINSFDVNFFFANTDDYYEAYKVQPIKMLMTYKYTWNNGGSTQYAYNGDYYGIVSNSWASAADFVSIEEFSQGGQWTWFAGKSHNISGYVSDVKAVFSETTAPRVTSWELQNRENDTPLLWLIFSEELRPADQDLLNRKLLGEVINVQLAMTPAVDPNATPTMVDAVCVEFVSGGNTGTGKGRLGFEIVPEDWEELQQLSDGKTEWEIRAVIDQCTYGSYKIRYPFPLNDYYAPFSYSGNKNYYTAPLPITDTVGNTFRLGNISNINLKIDTVDPYIYNVFLTGDCLPASNTSGLDMTSWADTKDLDWTDLFVGGEDSFYATLELNEEIQQLTDAEKAEIYLEWNILGKDGNPLRTYLSEMKAAPYVNGSTTITQLVFAPLNMGDAAATESGKQVRPAKLHGAQYVEDFYNNSMSEAENQGGVYDLSAVSPDKQVYLDVVGPTVNLGEVLRGGLAGNASTYSVELTISDKTSEEEGRFFAGMVGGDSSVMGSLSIYSASDIPAIRYQYSLRSVEESFDGTYEHSGVLSSQAAQTPVPLEILKEGTYILYLKLEGGNGLEISDDSGAILDFTLWDILGNTSRQQRTLTNLQLDKVAPTASETHNTVITSGNPTNTATFSASVTASDLNGIKRIEYQWGTDDAVTQVPYNNKEKNVTLEIPAKTVTGTGMISDTLAIRVYDIYDNETVLDTISYQANLEKWVPQAQYSGDPNYPCDTNDVIITAPLTTGGSDKVDGYVRVVYQSNQDTYVIGTGAIGKEETISLFGTNHLTWVSANKNASGQYVNVTALESSGLKDIYGYVDFTIWVSANDLAVADYVPENPTTQDTHSQTAQSMTMSIARTSKRDDVHKVTFGDLTLSSGAALELSEYQGLQYAALFPNTFVGARYSFTIANQVMTEWSMVDMDWDQSYAVLLRTNADGTLPETDEEVSQRISLATGINQCLVVPGLDKNGTAFTTGVYVWKIHLAQKAGGSQEFVAPTRLLLDAVKVNPEFGVYSYTNETLLGNGSYGAYDVATDPEGIYCTLGTLAQTQRNEDGTPLTTINVGVAEPYDGYGSGEIIKDANGRDRYAIFPVNGSGYLEVEFSMDTTQLGEHVYMGEQLGQLEGFRYWNADAPVDLETLPFEIDSAYSTDDRACLWIREYIDWYVGGSIVVDDLSALEPADSHRDFRVTLGKNRIAYQMKLKNGMVSDVRYVDLVLRTVVPTIDVEFTPGPGRTHDIELEDGNTFQQWHTTYVTAGITNFTSVSGKLDVYQLTMEETSGYYSYALRKADPNNIKLTLPSNGYEGFPDQNAYEPEVQDYFLAVDEYGNGVVVYPIIGTEYDVSDDTYDTAIIDGLGKIQSLEWNYAETGERGRYVLTIGHTFSGYEDGNIIQVMDGYSVQIDDREPVYITAKPMEYISDEDGYTVDIIDHNAHIVNEINDAGIYEVDDDGGVKFSFPYNPELALGADQNHTITVRAYLNGEETDEETYYVWGSNSPNLRPIMVPYNVDWGQVKFDSQYSNLTNEQLAAGDYWPEGRIYGTADVKLAGGEEFTSYHTVKVTEAGDYTVEFMDKYGDVYTQVIPLSLTEDPKVTISTTEPTAGAVEVTVTSEQYELSLGRISYYENDEEKFLVDVPEGTIVEGEGTRTLKLTLYTNTDDYTIPHPLNPSEGFTRWGLYVYYGENEDYLRIFVGNIYREPIEPYVEWSYLPQEVLDYYEVDGVVYENVVFGSVEAVLQDEWGVPLIDPLTGETPRFTFEPGGPTSYTFSGYTNFVGVPGEDYTVTLPVTLLEFVAPVYPDDPEPVRDVWAPNVAIYGNTTYEGSTQSIPVAYLNTMSRDSVSPIAEITTDWAQNWTDAYTTGGIGKIVNDSDSLMASFGWAGMYRLNLDILDESATKIFITNADNIQAPDYAAGSSEVVDGVSVIGKSVLIEKNSYFIIHVVDESNNYVSVPIRVTALGDEAPVPNYALVLSRDGRQVRAYLMPPNVEGVEDLTITGGSFQESLGVAVETDTQSVFCGIQYVVYTENKDHFLYYTYKLNGHEVSGRIEFTIDKIDTSTIQQLDGYPKWSANYDANATEENLDQTWIRMTNQSITVQFAFTRTIGDAYFQDEEGNRVEPANASVTYLGTQATVEYTQNGQPLKLVCVNASNDSQLYFYDLPAIMTIDKVAPAIFETNVTYSANHRSAEITLKVNEQSMLQSDGKYLAKADGETYYMTTQMVRANGEYTFTVVDRAGNRTSKTVNVDGIITDELLMWISTSASDAGIVDPAVYAPNVGDTVYIKTSRDAKITMDHSAAEISAVAEQWTAVTIADSLSGLYPIIRAVDAYGNSAVIQLESVPMSDSHAPTVILRKSLISVELGSTDEEIRELLKSNLLAADDITPADQMVYTFTYSKPAGGAKVNVTYEVTDASGNTASCTGQIRFYNDQELVVKVNGNAIEREETVIVKKGTIDVNIHSAGEPYKAQWKTGIKTVAQMKTNSQSITSYTDEAKSYSVVLNESGYYTIVITTQSQDNYRIILYVED